jgi:hypothetical protein
LDCGKILKGPHLRFKVADFENRQAIALSSRIGAPENNHPARVVVRQGAQQYGIYDTEDRGICPDSQSQSDYGNNRKRWFFCQHARGVTEVLN